jgi:V/A-type H+-transporting ATPase subunit D
VARLQLSKSSLSRETQQLASFQRFLPSLDLKRRQLMAERAKARARLAATRSEIDRMMAQVGETIPMLANVNVDLSDLAKITKVELGTENIVGTRLPRLKAVEVEVRPYSYMGKPHWVDRVVEDLKRMVELRLREQVERQRLRLLEAGVKKVTQRVNLFDKVLIPRAQGNIKRIKIFLGDAERASVINSKLAKAKQRALSEP